MDLAETMGSELAGALEKKGFTALTQVQRDVLERGEGGADLRISSQTGSGKTVAIGLAVRDVVRGESEPARGKDARPRVLVVVPTRELAKQVDEELTWLYAPLGISVASVTGGGGYRDELRAFRRGPAVVVGTPGRLLDHLERGAIDPSNVAAVALDEADRMLDLGFRDDIEKIFQAVPAERRTLLVSATFPREVLSLADRVQRDPVRIEGTPLGAANSDIEHVIHLVRPDERLAAIINLLLAEPGSQTLIFARTRAGVAELTSLLQDAGFFVGMLSGEMEQPERLRALAAFKSGTLDALVATDVAARGIDVNDISRVIHCEPPGDPDAYTHRSGRTGRAGKKGTSSVLVVPSELVKTSRLLNRARVRFRLEPVPAANALRDARDQRLFDELTAPREEDAPPEDPRARALAQRLAESAEVVDVLTRLVASAARARCEPRPITPIEPPQSRRPQNPLPLPPRASERNLGALDRDDEPRKTKARREEPAGGWVPFHVSWGGVHGAEPRRLVAMLCRRGGIDNRAIGAIRVDRTFSVVQIAADRAEGFEQATREPDPRDPRVQVRRFEQRPRHGAPHEERPPREERPAREERPPREERPAREERPPREERPQGDRRPPHKGGPPHRGGPPGKGPHKPHKGGPPHKGGGGHAPPRRPKRPS